MSDIDDQVAAFAASIEGAVFVDDETFQADVAALLNAIDGNLNDNEAGAALVSEFRRLQPPEYGKAVAVEAARRLSVYICLGAPTWRIAYLTKCVSRLAFTCRIFGYGEVMG